MRALPQELQEQPYEAPLEPHTILPPQFFTGAERRRARNAEERLMFAILEDAVTVYCNYCEPATRKQRRTFVSTQRWLTNSDRTWLFSFLRICEALDLDPEYIRKGLRQRRAARVPRRRRLRAPAWGQTCPPLRLT